MSKKLRDISCFILLGLLGTVWSQEPQEESELKSLKQEMVPEPKNLDQFVKDRNAAIELGKALFWDMHVGSDGKTSCASCHFHAGADNRFKNQISPGLLRVKKVGTDTKGEPIYEGDADMSFHLGGPNFTLDKDHFPYGTVSEENDVVSSQGVFLENFEGLSTNGKEEIRSVVNDEIFFVGDSNTRRVEPRNTPTVINSIFNLRNFWDGRAQDRFNGVNPFGRRDENAKVWRASSPQEMEQVSIDLDNASLASQAVGPPLSTFEMSAAGRLFPELGRKLLKRKPLSDQLVAPDDSVLGVLSEYPEPGLDISYDALIRQAFHREWWQGTVPIDVQMDGSSESQSDTMGLAELSRQMRQPGIKGRSGKKAFTHMEANFSLFFGLAIQLYEATLVSDDTPFDKFIDGQSDALTDQQKRGMEVFLNKGKCANCHGGAEFTKATVSHIMSPGTSSSHQRLERMIMGNGEEAIYDNGFYNIGVRPTTDDLGVGGLDPWGDPLGESRLAKLRGPDVFKKKIGVEPNENVSENDRVAVDGAFKTPTLRNIELTAPYFHNGGMNTLMQVVEFYDRGGDFDDENKENLDPDIQNLGLGDQEKEDLVAFLLALTDERVRNRKAPFDHPQLFIPNGHVGNDTSVEDDGQGRAVDLILELPPTGKDGGAPFPNFPGSP